MTEYEKNLLRLHQRRVFRNDLAKLRTRQGSFEATMLHFDHPIPGMSRYLEASDHGAAAERICENAEVTPLWQKLFQNAAARLPKTGKAVLWALKSDWRTANAARLAGVSRPTVYHWKKQFKIIFAPCFRAWERDFRHL